MLEIKLSILFTSYEYLPRMSRLFRLYFFFFVHCLSFNINSKRRVSIFVVSVLWYILRWVNIYCSIESRWGIDSSRDNSNSPTTTMVSRGSSRISIGVRVVDERAAERRGNVRASTYTARCLHADLAPEKLPSEPYTNMNKPTRLAGKSPGVGGYPQRPERRISEKGWFSLLFLPTTPRGVSWLNKKVSSSARMNVNEDAIGKKGGGERRGRRMKRMGGDFNRGYANKSGQEGEGKAKRRALNVQMKRRGRWGMVFREAKENPWKGGWSITRNNGTIGRSCTGDRFIIATHSPVHVLIKPARIFLVF